MQIKRLIPADITTEYIETLNDVSYMQYSRNVKSIHTIESQIQYIKSFSQISLSPKSLIFGIFLHDKLICSLTVYFDKEALIANVGILVIKSYASKGVAKYSLSRISQWISARYPSYKIQVGTYKSNLPMIRTALSCNFIQISSNSQDHLFFQYVGSSSQNNALPTINEFTSPVLFFASDTGGAEHLMEVYLRANLDKSLLINGKGGRVFEYYGIKYLREVTCEYSDYQSMVFSTGASNLDLISVQKQITGLSTNQACVLDHWVNYSKRFSVKGLVIPKTFIVTNEISHFLAHKHFPSSTVVLIPDYRLERLQSLVTVNFSREDDCILVLLEPERAQLEGLSEITPDTHIKTVMQAMSLCQSMGLKSVVLRLHPAMRKSRLIKDYVGSQPLVRFSSHSRIEDDLHAAKAVIGLSSSLLYITASLGIPTFSTLDFAKDSWMGLFSKIRSLPKQ